MKYKTVILVQWTMSTVMKQLQDSSKRSLTNYKLCFMSHSQCDIGFVINSPASSRLEIWKVSTLLLKFDADQNGFGDLEVLKVEIR